MARRRKSLSREPCPVAEEENPTSQKNVSDGEDSDGSDVQILPIRPSPPARIYKRWMVLSSVLTLFFAWKFLPYYVNRNMIPKPLESLGEYIFETSLFRLLPDVKIPEEWVGNLTSILQPFWFDKEYGRKTLPGLLLKKEGAKAHFPVILVPGIISTGLELWEGKECARPYFREHLWGTLTMLRTMLLDKECWIEHMRLDPKTGADPEGIRVRPAQGLEAADFILPGFWVWARIIENLAELGYDHNNLQMAAYDWRLDIVRMELRDHYFSRLKSQVELMVKTNDRKLVIITHSLGAVVWHYFMKWVEADIKEGKVKGGGGGPKWIDKHVHSVVHIGGAFLGAPKSLSTCLSGETRDTVQMGRLESYIMELFLSKAQRTRLFRTWFGGVSIFPRGGNLIWGDGVKGVREAPGKNLTIGLINKGRRGESMRPFFADDIDQLLVEYVPQAVDIAREGYSYGVARTMAEAMRNNNIPRKWINPLEVQLPLAPAMTVYCFYGVGKETERGYMYKSLSDQLEEDPKEILMTIDAEVDSKHEGISKGIYHVDGDGTIPLISLGFMGVKGWPSYKHLNPANVKTVVKEFKDEPSSSGVTDVRGGPRSGDHVDILGNHELTMDVLRIVTNTPAPDAPKGSIIEQRIVSNIEEIVKGIDIEAGA